MPATELRLSYLPRILIIDDNQDIHRDFRLAFRHESPNPDLQASEDLVFLGDVKHRRAPPEYEVEHALSGLEGIEKVRQALAKARPFQLAFVDIRMPGMDGVETVTRLWRIDPLIQIILVTAYADYSWDELALSLGRTDKLLMLKKPFEYIEVIQMASTLTEKWFLGRQAALKLEQMELLVAKRTQKLLELQRLEAANAKSTEAAPCEMAESPAGNQEPPVVLVVEANADAQFLRRTTEIVEKHLADFEFDVEKLSRALFMSRRQLLRKLKAVAGYAPNALIRSLRLKRAAELLRSSGMTVTEITYAVGFSDLKHFRSLFRNQFGLLPAEYARAAGLGGAGNPKPEGRGPKSPKPELIQAGGFRVQGKAAIQTAKYAKYAKGKRITSLRSFSLG
jgi:AraC-like DNA-binding protein/DNA-binding NarL/FixJ family response regulator